MKTIYIDNEFKCHITNPNGDYEAVETDIFDGKCDEFIEGYRFIPSERTWVRENGVYIKGEAMMPWRNYSELRYAQINYEEALAVEQKEALKILGVSL